jgi:hypothetical protein
MQKFYPGKPVLYEVPSHNGRYSAFFEDDNETGYFYVMDMDRLQVTDDPIVEAFYIYTVKHVSDRDREAEVEIIWSSDGLKTCLLINSVPHAIADFESRRGYCRSNFPSPNEWKEHDFTWDDQVMDLLFGKPR